MNNCDFVVHYVSNTFFLRSVFTVDCKKLFLFFSERQNSKWKFGGNYGTKVTVILLTSRYLVNLICLSGLFVSDL